ncbi:hypothetical protein [Bacillus sp. OTU530]|uniref:hypothetical protein n=1 Tax=Bacillus sp. OTU530 TaxID=3043862 RepID=UPI00313AAEE7
MREGFFNFIEEQIEREKQAKPSIKSSPLHLLMYGYGQSKTDKARHIRDNSSDLLEMLKQDNLDRKQTALDLLKAGYDEV